MGIVFLKYNYFLIGRLVHTTQGGRLRFAHFLLNLNPVRETFDAVDATIAANHPPTNNLLANFANVPATHLDIKPVQFDVCFGRLYDELDLF